MGIAAGGLIKQAIDADEYAPNSWEPECSTIFNVQMLNSACFSKVVGTAPPATPITAALYAEYGFPYFSIWDEVASGVSGDFTGVKSVNDLDQEGKPTEEKTEAVQEVIKSTHNPVVLLNSEGQQMGFRTLSQLEEAVRARFPGLGI